ncbi:MAG TPA: DUF3293 domain-containing protein [Dongiaceae bacterium]|jgi:hypothetical protein
MLDERLIAAYTATDYVLHGEDGELILNIGRASPQFDAIFDRRGADTAVIVTAYNPRSVVLSDAENQARHQALMEVLRQRDLDFEIGEGRDPSGHWKAEIECVVYGISLETGLELAQRFDQNAIVFIRRGAAPELHYPKLD